MNTNHVAGGNVSGVSNAVPVTIWRKRARQLWRSLIPTLFITQAIATILVIHLALQHPGKPQTVGENLILLVPIFGIFPLLLTACAICDHLANRAEGDYRN